MKLRKLAALAMTAVLSLTVLAGCGSDDKNQIKSDGKKAASISEAFEKAADGKATKIIIPSEIQGIAGLAKSVVESVKEN